MIRPFPGGGEGGDGTGGGAAEAAVVGVGRDVEVEGGDEFFDEEVGVVGAHAIVFEGAVEAGLGSFAGGGDDSGVYEEADGDGHVTGGDELVDDIGCVAGFSGVVDEASAILKDHEAGGF